MTWPIGFAPEYAYSTPRGDYAFGIWNFWWTAIAHQQGSDPMQSDRIFYPGGTGLAWRDYPLLITWLSIPITLRWSPLVSYNICYILSFIIAGSGAFLLCHFITRCFAAALAGGIVFAFTPAHFIVYTQQTTCHIEWLPLLLLALLRLRQSGNLSQGLWAGLWLACTLHCNIGYGIYAGFGFLLFTVWVLRFPPVGVSRFRLLSGLSICFVTTVLLFAPRWIPMLRESSALVEGIVSSGATRGDLLGASFPLPSGPRLVSWPAVFGYVATGGALITLLSKNRRRYLSAWLGLGFYFSLALGSTLRVAGREISIVPMPMDVLRHLPVLNNLRATHRAVIFMALIIGILFAITLARVVTHESRPWRRKLICCVVLSLLMLELWPVRPQKVISGDIEYFESLGRSRPQKAVLTIPLNPLSGALNRAMFAQTIHGKPLTSGFSSRPTLEQMKSLAAVPLPVALLEPSSSDESELLKIPSDAQAGILRRKLREFEIDTITLDPRFVRATERKASGPRTGYRPPSFSIGSLWTPVWWGQAGAEVSPVHRASDLPGSRRDAFLPFNTQAYLSAVLGLPKLELEDGTLVWELD